MRKKGKALKLHLFVLMAVFSVLCVSPCNVTAGTIDRLATQNACDTFILNMKKNKRSSAVQRVGVFRMDSGSTGNMARECLHNALIRHTGLDIIGMDDMREKEKMLETLGKQFKYQRRYDPETLVKLGKMIAVKCIVTGRIVDLEPKVQSSRVVFQGQVLDLGGGRILYSELVEGFHVKPVTAAELGIDIAIAVLALGLMWLLSQLDIFFGKEYREVLRRRVMQAGVIFLTTGGFAAYYLVLR
ncbi:MAG: hypothetical protein U9R20_03680 [Thermodesulfobacteriota bacterium]|nr:hypothetical protein [Thermodesulfobacteriota bacterium]